MGSTLRRTRLASSSSRSPLHSLHQKRILTATGHHSLALKPRNSNLSSASSPSTSSDVPSLAVLYAHTSPHAFACSMCLYIGPSCSPTGCRSSSSPCASRSCTCGSTSTCPGSISGRSTARFHRAPRTSLQIQSTVMPQSLPHVFRQYSSVDRKPSSLSYGELEASCRM